MMTENSGSVETSSEVMAAQRTDGVRSGSVSSHHICQTFAAVEPARTLSITSASVRPKSAAHGDPAAAVPRATAVGNPMDANVAVLLGSDTASTSG
jgi:hypothetical protein